MCNNENYKERTPINLNSSSSVLSCDDRLVDFSIEKSSKNSLNIENKNSIISSRVDNKNRICDDQTVEKLNCNNNKDSLLIHNIKASIPSVWNFDLNKHHKDTTLINNSLSLEETPTSELNHKQQKQTRQEVLEKHRFVSPSLPTTLPELSSSSSRMLGNGVIPPGLLPPLEHYRLQLYNYAMVERLRCSQYHNNGSMPVCPPGYSNTAAATAANNPYGSRFAFSMSLFHNRVFQPEEPKPQHSYIGLIAMAILSSPESKLVLSDIYQHILDNYPYFRTRGPGWRNSIRHNLSLNDCFIKAGRSANGKGHYWAIHPANLEDFKKGDFRRRKAQRKVRKHMGLAVDDEGTDSPSPPALVVTPPPHHSNVISGPFCPTSWAAAAVVASGTPTAGVVANIYSQSRKRQFDVASLLAPDEDINYHQAARYFQNDHHLLRAPASKRLSLPSSTDIDEYIDVVASDAEDNNIRQIPSKILISKSDEDEKNCIQSVPLTESLSIPIREKSNRLDDRDIQSGNDEHEATTDSPVSNQMDDDISGLTIESSSPTTWQGLMQQWPNNLNSLGIGGGGSITSTNTAAAMDPRVLGRYYGQYIAAAAAQQMAVSRRTMTSVGSFLNSNHSLAPSNENTSIMNMNVNNAGSVTGIQTQNNNNKTLIIEKNNNSDGNFNSDSEIHSSNHQQ